MAPHIPERLRATCLQRPEWELWLRQLPAAVRDVQERWSLRIGPVYADASCAWVAPVTMADQTPAVLKLGLPHMEGRDEAEGLRFWNGDPAVQLLVSYEPLGAMLLERCEPGSSLRQRSEFEQNQVIADLLCRLWRTPPGPHPFRPLSTLMEVWTEETLDDAGKWVDEEVVREGLRLFAELPRTAPAHVLLATDLHAGNVLRAERQPWLMIDPKPFFGDAAYDLTQHILNCSSSLGADPLGTIGRFADLVDIDQERVRLWTFARLAAEPRDDWSDGGILAMAKAIVT